jgi:dTMP kinase
MSDASTGERGLLIAFEGLDGSGKTTQRKLLKDWLVGSGEEVVVTKWSSSPRFKPIIKAKKAEQALTPEQFALLHAADFHDRYSGSVVPALREGKTVLADRYTFTGVARDSARGLDREWSMKLYEPAMPPDIVFYFSVSPETCLKRILATRTPKYYESGQDVTGIADPCDSYRTFTRKIVAEYERLSDTFPFVVVDAEQGIYAQHRFIRLICEEWKNVAPRFESYAMIA